MNLPDTTVVDIHRMQERQKIHRIDGDVWRVLDRDQAVHLNVGDELGVGDTIALGPSAELEFGERCLTGGRHGRAHALVAPDAFLSSPSRDDVGRLLQDLEQIEKQLMDQVGMDPLSIQGGPTTPLDRAVASDYAFSNLTQEAIDELDPEVGHELGAVPLFIHGDSACVAVAILTVRKMRALMEALDRPITPHVVDAETLQILLKSAYGGPAVD